MALLTEGVPLVSLDVEAGQGTLFTGHSVALANQFDLDQLLERIWSEKLS
jgi:hypothetical protein